MRKIQVWGSRDGGSLKVYNHGLRGTVLRIAEDSLDFVDGVILRHALCGSGPPEFAWKIPVGKAQVDPKNGMLNNSLGSLLYDSYSRATFWLDRQCERDLVATVPITEENLRLLAPSLRDYDEEED